MKTIAIIRYVFCISLTGLSIFLTAQDVLYPGLDGLQLQEALRDGYRPAFTLTLAQAKDTLYTIIDNAQDSVEGIYSGYKLFLPDGVDASQWLFMNGSGINLEHVYPQSKGADEGMAGHSDMHHLFPSRVAVNEARASFPFMEIADQTTTKWYRNDQVMQNIPTSDIDTYSEYVKGQFEPRESVKGNIARAVFYFYTMYQQDADAADPQFFPMQRPILCQWHLQDPVDDAELTRSAQVAHYQDDKENPFILDCTAALRAWCPEFNGCTTSYVTHSEDAAFSMSAYVNQAQINVHFMTTETRDVLLSVHDLAGQKLLSTRLTVLAGSSEYTLLTRLPPGMYAVSCIPDSALPSIHVVRCTVK